MRIRRITSDTVRNEVSRFPAAGVRYGLAEREMQACDQSIEAAGRQKFPPVKFRSGFRLGAGVGVGFRRNPGVRGPPAAFRREKGMCRGSALGRFGRAFRRARAPRPAAATVRTVRRRSGPPPRARGSGRGGGSASRGSGSRESITGFSPGGTSAAPSPPARRRTPCRRRPRSGR